MVYRDGAAGAEALTQRLEHRLHFKATHRYRHVLRGFAGRLSARQVRALRAIPAIDYVARDEIVRAESSQRLAAGEALPITVRRIQGLGRGAVDHVHRASSVNVAILDTGVDLEHPDLNVRHGTNCVYGEIGQPADDIHGHGTAVAGIVGAKNQGAGVVGVAPGTRVYAVKVLGDTGRGWVSDVICGLEWSVQTLRDRSSANDIRVVNMSLSVETARALDDAVWAAKDAGIVPAVASGNNGLDAHRFSPGRSGAGLVATAMFDDDGIPRDPEDGPDASGWGQIMTYSNWGYYDLDVGGIRMLRLVAAPVGGATTAPGGGYVRYFDGTSAAAPHIAATVALCFGEGNAPGECAGMTPTEVVDHIWARSREYTFAHDRDFGFVDADYGFQGDPMRPDEFDYTAQLHGATPVPWEYVPRRWWGYLVAPVHEHP